MPRSDVYKRQVVILLIVVIQMIRPGKDEVKDTAAPTESSQTVESMPETEPETEPETQPEAERYVVTGNSVNVRTEPVSYTHLISAKSDLSVRLQGLEPWTNRLRVYCSTI